VGDTAVQRHRAEIQFFLPYIPCQPSCNSDKKGEKSQASSMHQEFLLLSVALMHDYDSQEKIICITDVNHRICIPSHILKLDILSYNKIGGF
jgi:hypothetical protein